MSGMSGVLENDVYLDIDRIKYVVESILVFIKDYRWIIDAYVSDYFLKCLPDQLPTRWSEALRGMRPDELASLLYSKTWKTRTVWPLSLLTFRSFVTGFCLKREPDICTVDLLKSLLKEQENSDIDAAESVAQDAVEIVDGQYLNLEHCYRRHVKPKKQHEIQSLGRTLRSLCTVCSCDHVVDVGAGQGHLSRLLTFGFKVKVTTVEASGCHAPKAEKFDREVKRDIQAGRIGKKNKKKSITSEEERPSEDAIYHNPHHIVATIDPSIPVDQFLDTLQLTKPCDPTPEDTASSCHRPEHFVSQGPGVELIDSQMVNNESDTCAKYSDASETVGDSTKDGSADRSREFILNGLHACGDLTPTMLRVFVQCPAAVGLSSVGCCYMKLTTESRESEEATSDNASLGYPMSSHVRELPQRHLSYEALEMACHFIDCYHTRLLENSPSLRCHSYRAALQEVIAEKHPNMTHGCIKLTLKNVHERSFQGYASAALARLGIEPSLSLEQLERAECRLARWREVVAFYTLRLSLAPLLETVVLLDRLLYLAQQDIKCCLRPVFDPKLSPRNFVLLAAKNHHS